MSGEKLLRLPASQLEELRCFQCEGYLSCSPVRLLSNGKNICGRCDPLNDATPIHRQVAFEVVLNHISFPCIFRKYGCGEMLLFNQTIEHELKCTYKPIACPFKRSPCAWEGIASHLLEHLQNAHPGFVKEKFEFKLELGQDVEGLTLATEDSFPCIVKYIYKAGKKSLEYDIRYFENKIVSEASWTMQLINGTDSNCRIGLKSNKCLPYDQGFMQKANILNLRKFLEPLDDPDYMIVAVKFKFVKSVNNNLKVDFNAINNLKCRICTYYLIPPLFDWKGKAICHRCSKTKSNIKPYNDINLVKRVNVSMYPCRWRECDILTNIHVLFEHEINCQFRLCVCVWPDCQVTFKLQEAACHLQTHEMENVIYMPDKITYKTLFIGKYSIKKILTMKHNRIILFSHTVMNNCIPTVELKQADDDRSNVNAAVVFEHEHCKLKSEEFIVNCNNKTSIGSQGFPKCFKNTEELTVTVKLVIT